MTNKIKNLVMGLIVCFCLVSLVGVSAQEIITVELNCDEKHKYSFSYGGYVPYDADIMVSKCIDNPGLGGNYVHLGLVSLSSVTDADIPASGYKYGGCDEVIKEGHTYINKNDGGYTAEDGGYTAFIITKLGNCDDGIIMQYKNLGGGGGTTGQTGTTTTVQAQEVTYSGVKFPLGDVSFADRVVNFNPGSGTGESDGSAAIGPPDGGKNIGPSIIGDKGDVTLGSGGSITLKFTDNYLIDVEGLDLYVFEFGPSVEPFKVEISKDGSNWIDLGTVSGQPTGLDIHSKVASSDKFSYVRITAAGTYSPRDPKEIGAQNYVGSDIDAVGAIGAEERPDSDGDGVPDDEDRCPNTPPGTEVDESGCPTSTSGDSEEADVVCLVGDIDNLGFGWPSGFDVFSGKSTPSHRYPWKHESDDPPGTDRIMVGSGAKGSSDGYSSTTSKPDNNPQPITMECDLNDVVVKSATLQMFVDDFQSPVFGSKFQAKINNKRAPFLENVLNSLRQTGPIGKLITVQIPDEFLSDVSSGKLIIYIDDPETGVGDGYAIDFVRLLINPSGDRYVGSVSGKVTDAKTGQPISGAKVTASGTGASVTTAGDGTYTINNVPAGMASLTASKTGYESKTLSVDLVADSHATLNFALTQGASPTDIAPIPIDPTAPPCTGTSTYAYIESITMQKGKEARITVMMCNAKDLANMDFSISYNPSVLRFKDAEKGSLNSNSLFESNEISSGNVKISFASSKGVSGSGSIAILIFDVVGSNGDSTTLTGNVNTASTSSGSPISITINPGKFTVGSSVPGDCDGDGLVTSKDALAALQMSVEKLKVDLCYDVTGDGTVNSADAREILKKAVKK